MTFGLNPTGSNADITCTGNVEVLPGCTQTFTIDFTTTGFTSYVTLEDVARDAPAKENSVEIIEGVFRDNDKLISLINPEKLRVWIDSEFTKGDD